MTVFVDESQLHAKGGDGGAGAVAFRREAHVAKGGPDGGDGGSGGDVWLVADANVASLLGFRDHPHRRAGDGTHGQGKRRHGAGGDDEIVRVPAGTQVRRRADGEVLADLADAGARWMAAQGGRGGKGNARFLSNRRRAPAFAEQGEVGQEEWYDLELKLLADVALVGMPNVGKSTLISVMSAARPKIADYPFTTLVPNLGVVRHGDAEFVVADVPGLIEGASDGRGLGHRFLRHVERARVLAVLVDLAPVDGVSPARQHDILLDELSSYDIDLASRPRLVVGTKADLCPPDHTPAGLDVALQISSVTRAGVAELTGALAELVATERSVDQNTPSFVLHRPEGAGVQVTRADDGAFVVEGRDAAHAVGLTDLTDPQAMDVVRDRLDRLGVPKALRRAGVSEGDTVRIGRIEMTWEPEDLDGLDSSGRGRR